MDQAFKTHLESGSTTLCRAWRVVRRDGQAFGFTDHDRDLHMDGLVYRAQTGLTARALQQTTGMAVDNSEALGALSDAAVSEDDIAAGRFDDAEITALWVNWADPSQRMVLFRGNFGEITRSRGAFHVELRGLTERLNLTFGRAYHRGCSARLGDRQCGVDLGAAGLVHEAVLLPDPARRLRVHCPAGVADGWFDSGKAEVLDGGGRGQMGMIRHARRIGSDLVVELWNGFALPPAVGDCIRLQAGCDRQAETCRAKFDNFLNFRGFPHIPGEDWLRVNPALAVRG